MRSKCNNYVCHSSNLLHRGKKTTKQPADIHTHAERERERQAKPRIAHIALVTTAAARTHHRNDEETEPCHRLVKRSRPVGKVDRMQPDQ